MDTDWKIQAGQCVMGGFPGTEISPEFERLVKEYKVGNVILFQRNLESMEQTGRLCESIQKLIKKETGHAAFIAIDQEGGTVTRLPADGCNVPGAMATAATGHAENAEISARITAKELKSVGVNFNLAPVMDVNNNPDNPLIGVRSFGDTAETVSAFGIAAVRGYMEGGILPCAKHFPGHGDTTVDSHVGLPVIGKSLQELEDLELKPFRAAIDAGLPAVMSAHILFPQLEPDSLPCPMSKRVITGILREKLRFQGLVISDCLEMDAIRKYYGTAQGMTAALAAGVDIALVSHTAALLEEGILAVYKAVEEGKLSKERIRESAERILRLKAVYAEQSTDAGYTSATKCAAAGKGFYGCGCTEEDRQKIKEIRRKSVTAVQGQSEKSWKSFLPGASPFFTGCAGYRTALVLNEENVPETFAEYMAEKLGGTAFVTTKDPGEAQIAEAVKRSEGATGIVVSLFNSKERKGQQKLMRELARSGVPVIAVALYSPYDLQGLPENVLGIAAWDNSPMTLEVLTELFRGDWEPEGKMPVKL